MIADVTAKAGMIDILVNNFDHCDAKALDDVSRDQWRLSFDRNVDPIFFMIREILPGMKARKYGRVVNIGSYPTSACRTFPATRPPNRPFSD